jgi:hypothetical protein
MPRLLVEKEESYDFIFLTFDQGEYLVIWIKDFINRLKDKVNLLFQSKAHTLKFAHSVRRCPV